MNGAKYPDHLWSDFDSGFMAIKSTKHPEVVQDFFTFMSQPKYGALWSALTTQPSTLNFDAAKDWPAERKGCSQVEVVLGRDQQGLWRRHAHAQTEV